MMITMKASLTTSSDVPWCAYYNEATEKWDDDGLVIESVYAQASGEAESDSLQVDLSCVSYHLSDFAVSTTEAEGIFTPVKLVRCLMIVKVFCCPEFLAKTTTSV